MAIISSSSAPKVAGLDFDFTTPTGAIIRALPMTERIKYVLLIIDIPFNDPAAKASVGLMGDVEKFMSKSDNRLQLAGGEFDVAPNYITVVPSTTVRFFLTPGASTQGKGSVYLIYL